ncbi:hypothetical protein, partial [Pseudonocardia sp. NPDC046786]|uniref:hypothetical protein n=1 Tax=Pseudonocardia sp. NPDC046786 TaxID=3155471 RepID=UPI0033F63A7F
MFEHVFVYGGRVTTVIDAPAASDPPAASGLPAVPDLDAVRARFEQLAAVVDEVSPSPVLVDRMIALVAVRNSVEAALVATELAFARRRAADSAAEVDPERLERSIGAEI